VQISSTRIRDKSVILVPFLTALFIFVVARVYSMANAWTNDVLPAWIVYRSTFGRPDIRPQNETEGISASVFTVWQFMRRSQGVFSIFSHASAIYYVNYSRLREIFCYSINRSVT
jgi:hypothetical protein